MVEGHSVHRIVTTLGRRLLGRKMKASSPNGRFKEGAEAIDGKQLKKFDAIGKNLFCIFDTKPKNTVVHVHFGMAGRWAVFDAGEAPPPTSTTRLVLKDNDFEAHLSAMTVQHGAPELFDEKASKLGEDPLRTDADPDALWERVRVSKKTIGLLLMDQSFFPGVGNIYRAEIGVVSGVHPSIPGRELQRAEFDAVWGASVALLRKGYESGSIITTTPAELKRGLRRYIYNRSSCGKCGGQVLSWNVANRTCYACPSCQPRRGTDAGARADTPCSVTKVPFHSHCAPDPFCERLSTPWKLTCAELRTQLALHSLATGGRKAELCRRLELALETTNMVKTKTAVATKIRPAIVASSMKSKSAGCSKNKSGKIASASVAEVEKHAAGESRAVEHVAELDRTAEGATEKTVCVAISPDRNARQCRNTSSGRTKRRKVASPAPVMKRARRCRSARLSR